MTWTANFTWALGITAAAAIVVAIAGAVLTEIGPWYDGLKKPSWKPPDWAFGPVWTTIFVLTTIAAALAWEAAQTPEARTAVVTVLAINAILNIAWSGIFFKLRRPDWALGEVALLWLSIVSLIVVLGAQSTLAGVLIIPYLAWVSTAAFLNLRIVQMNAPFG
jgi:tryptophan-rich sensory protein